MFGNSQMGGIDIGFPDVCLTPTPQPTPVPYPNIGAGPTAAPAAYKILWMGTPAHNMASRPVLSNGDNAGVNTGVASGSVMGPVSHVTASFTTLLIGMPATRMTSVSLQNNTNCPGVRLAPSQVKVVLLSP